MPGILKVVPQQSQGVLGLDAGGIPNSVGK